MAVTSVCVLSFIPTDLPPPHRTGWKSGSILNPMPAIIRRARLNRSWVPRKNSNFVVAHFSSVNSSSSSDTAAAGDQSFTISYLVDSCGLSESAAVSVSEKLHLKSGRNPDAVLKLLKMYGFTDAQITKLVAKWPQVLQCSPQKTLMPKLEFFRSIGVPDAVAARRLTIYPWILQRSLENNLIPSYNYLKSLIKSDEKIVSVFNRAPLALGFGRPKLITSNVAILRERGLPDSSIASLIVKKPSFFVLGGKKVNAYVDLAAEMGFDLSKVAFVGAIEMFAKMSERTLKRKMGVYKSCGWSESEAAAAFLRYPVCMALSEEKIRGNMDFLVNEVGFKPADIARLPVVMGLNVEKRMRPRWAVIKALIAKGLLQKSITVAAIVTLLKMGEEMFVERYVAGHEEEMPWLWDQGI